VLVISVVRAVLSGGRGGAVGTDTEEAAAVERERKREN
jgi:hypothetical protein